MGQDLGSSPRCAEPQLPVLTASRMEELAAGLMRGAPLIPNDCLALASTPGCPMRRQEDGLMEEWELWAQVHPHRGARVAVQVGTEARLGGGASELSVVSWNTLSRTWLEKCRDDQEYVNVQPECFDWGRRSQRLVANLLALDADVILLQEVDFAVFHESFLAPLSGAGYEGLMQNDRKRTEEQPCGNATFWKREKLQLQWEDHRSRTLLIGARLLGGPADGAEIAIINAHLEASRAKFEARASQLHSALGKVAQRSADAVVLAGDFNTGSDSAIHAVMRNHAWHGVALAAAYEHPAGAATSQASECTFPVSGGHCYAIDHLHYSHGMLQLTALLQALPSELRRECLGPKTQGLPNAHVPSDHIPIGAVFALSPPRTEAPAVAAPRVTTKEEEAELWSSRDNLLSEEQQQVWAALLAESLQKPKGKPTAEEIRALQLQKAQRLDRERSFIAELSAEARAFLEVFKEGRAMVKRATQRQ